MDAQKKNLLLELCDQMDERLQCESAHLDELSKLCVERGETRIDRRLILPRTINTKLREELSLMRTCILSESTPQQITAAAWNARKRA